jgi:putative transposase
MLRDRLKVSERRACRIVGQHRSTQRRPKTVAADDQALRAELREIAGERPRWGYRRAHHELGLRGWRVNRKRMRRVWREEGLRVPRRARKRRVPASQVDRSQLRAGRPDEVWAVDFQHDQTVDGRPIRLVNVVDEFTREALVMHAARSIGADELVAQLDARGAAWRFLRSDNGTELTSHALKRRGLERISNPRGGATKALQIARSSVIDAGGDGLADARPRNRVETARC